MLINKYSDTTAAICHRWNIIKENNILLIFHKKEPLSAILYSVHGACICTDVCLGFLKKWPHISLYLQYS